MSKPGLVFLTSLVVAGILLRAPFGLAQPLMVPAAKLYPTDQSATAPGFSEFKTRLVEALQRRDARFLGRIFRDSSVKIDWSNPSEANWRTLSKSLAMGGKWDGQKLVFPYFGQDFEERTHLSAQDYLVVVGSDVNFRLQPSLQAPSVKKLTYDIVKRLSGPQNGFYGVQLPVGAQYRLGYVHADYLLSPHFDPVAVFEKANGQWALTQYLGLFGE